MTDEIIIRPNDNMDDGIIYCNTETAKTILAMCNIKEAEVEFRPYTPEVTQ